MQEPLKPFNEEQRLEEVLCYDLLDTEPEADFDNLTALCSKVLDVPICLITLLDEHRNFLKSHHGVPFNESPRDISFCGHAILEEEELFVVKDAREDQRFHDNPLVTEYQAIFYAGVPLKSSKGYNLGTLCVFDHKPRSLDRDQIEILKQLAKQTQLVLDLKLKNKELTALREQEHERNEFLARYAHHVSHDLKSPLNNIDSLISLIKKDQANVFTEKTSNYINYVEQCSETLKNYINEILDTYKTNKTRQHKENLDVVPYFEMVKNIIPHVNASIAYPQKERIENINKSVLTQILINLIDNGLKYNYNKDPQVKISHTETDQMHFFEVRDNGRGINKEGLKNIFRLYKAGSEDKNGNKGHGIGLYAVKKLVNKSGGKISVESKLNEGTTFSFSLAK